MSPIATISTLELAQVTGGLKWQLWRRSSNVEDSRPAAQAPQPAQPLSPDKLRLLGVLAFG